MMGYMYILKCADGSYYTGSTVNLELRLQQHQSGEGANYTKNRIPVELVYFEEYERIDEAFYMEKQVQGWSRKKKEALINGNYEQLPLLAKKVFRKKAVASIRPLRGHSATVVNTNAVVECSEQSEEHIETTGKGRE